MSTRLKRSGFVWALLVCLVLVNGLMAVPSVGHAQHHADHKAGTHSTGICAWMCAAGDGIESSIVQFASNLQCIEPAISGSHEVVLTISVFSYFLRGPPVLPS